MKGVIVMALKELVVSRFGAEKWAEALKFSGIDQEPLLIPISDFDDVVCLRVIGSVCKVLNLTFEQAADAFGDYWVNAYAPKMYPAYYEGAKSAKDMLLKMDEVHVQMTRYMENSHPPRFEYRWKDEKTLVMKYLSSRQLIAFLIGLIKGVGKYYREELTVRQIGNNEVSITFC
jgi:hypothetical protein